MIVAMSWQTLDQKHDPLGSLVVLEEQRESVDAMSLRHRDRSFQTCVVNET